MTDEGRPAEDSTVVEKWKRVRENPHSCAALLEAVKIAILDVLFGFKPGDKRQSDPGCYCGVVLAVIVKVEQSGRLALHIHGGAIVAAFCIEHLRELFAGPNCKALAIANSMCCQWQQPPFYNRLPDGTPNSVHNWSAEDSKARGVAPPKEDRRCPAAGYSFLTVAGATPAQHKAAAARRAAAQAEQQQPPTAVAGAAPGAAQPPTAAADAAAGQAPTPDAAASPDAAQPPAAAEGAATIQLPAPGNGLATDAAHPPVTADGGTAATPPQPLALTDNATPDAAQPQAAADGGAAAPPPQLLGPAPRSPAAGRR